MVWTTIGLRRGASTLYWVLMLGTHCHNKGRNQLLALWKAWSRRHPSVAWIRKRKGLRGISIPSLWERVRYSGINLLASSMLGAINMHPNVYVKAEAKRQKKVNKQEFKYRLQKSGERFNSKPIIICWGRVVLTLTYCDTYCWRNLKLLKFLNPDWKFWFIYQEV